MGDLINLDIITTQDVDPNRVLSEAIKNDVDSLIVVGYDKSGAFYFASSKANDTEVLWMLEKAKLTLLNSET